MPTMTVNETRKLINKTKKLIVEENDFSTSKNRAYTVVPSKLSSEQKKELLYQLRAMTEQFRIKFLSKFTQVDKAIDIKTLATDADALQWYEDIISDLHSFTEDVFVLDDEISNNI